MLTRQQIPFVRIVLFYILGIVCADFIHLPYISIYLIGIIILSIPIYFINRKWTSKYRWIPGLSLMFLLCSTGFIGYNLQNPINHYDYIGQHTHRSLIIQLELLEKPKKGKKLSFLTKVNYTIDSNYMLNPASGKIICNLDTTDFKFYLDIGDQILIHTKLYPIRTNNNPGTFNYKSYLYYKQTNFQTYISAKDILQIDHREHHSIYEQTQKWREQLYQIIRINIPKSDNLGIISAMILGIKSDIDHELYQSFSNSGAVHILAVSGLHVGFIALILHFILSIFPFQSSKSNIVKNTILISALIIYGMITGMAPAIMRAIMMYSIYIIAKSWRPRTNNLNVLAFTAFIMLIYDPFMLFQAGFQFSFLAILSILVFFPTIRSLVNSRYTIIVYIRDMIALSLSAQILLFPITIYYFHKFPTYFFVSGLLAIPLAACILALGVLMIGIHFIFPMLNEVLIAPLLNKITFLLIEGIHWMNKWPFAQIEDIFLDKKQLITIYILLLFIVLFQYIRAKKLIILSLISIFIFLIFNISHNISYRENFDFIVYDSYKNTCIDIFIKNRCYSIQSNSISQKKINYLTKNYRLQKSITNSTTILLDQSYSDSLLFYQKQILQTGNKLFYIALDNKLPKINKEICLDYVILTNGTNLPLRAYIKNLHPDQIIVDHSISKKQLWKWKKEATKYNDMVHFISKQGIYTSSLK